MSTNAQDACARALERELGDRVSVAADRLEKYAWDFGRLIRRTPAVVVEVPDVEGLSTALRIGAEYGLPISTRGSGHSQSGQCLSDGALVLDMKALTGVEVDAERGSAWLRGGATWHQVCDAAWVQGRMPLGLTMIVDTTVGGTLSVGGVGSESFRTGMQVDQVSELEVATLDGRLVRCSPTQHRELFDAVRAGLGQCGIIVQARYPLRRAKARVRTYTLAYADARALVADMQRMGGVARCDLMFGGMAWSAEAGWQLLLFLGQEFDEVSELNDAAVLTGLHFERELKRADSVQWQADGRPGHPFFRRYEAPSGVVMHHPWADHLCEPLVAADLLSDVLATPAIAPRAGVCGALLGVAPHADRAPLVSPRSSGPLILLGLFPEASDAQLQDALARMRHHNERGAALGGKRYLSGFMDGWNAAEWAEHFGDAWPWFRSLKHRFDPAGLLNRDGVRWR